MKKLMPKGLTKKFFILGLLLILLPVTVVFIFAVNASQSHLTDRTHNQLNQEALYMAKQTNQMFEDKIQRMESAALYYRSTADDGVLQGLIDDLHVNDPFFRGTFLVDHEGNVDYSSAGVDATSVRQGVLRNVMEEMDWRRSTFLYTSQAEEPAKLYLSVPIHDEDHGPVDGAMIAEVSSSYIHNFFRSYADNSASRALFLNNSGVVLLDSMNANLGESFAEEDFFRNVKRERQDVIETEWRDQQVLISHHSVDRLPLYTVIITDRNYAYASTEELMEVLSLGWIVLFGFGIAMIIITRKWMVKPIKDLTEQSYQYADGEKWRIKLLAEKDEIQTLSTSMRFMAEDLKAKERYLKLILESFSYGVLTIDEEGTVTSINKAGERLIEYDKNDCIGKSYRKLPSKKLVKMFERHLRKQQLKETITDQMKYVDRTGKTKHMKLSISPLLNEDGILIGQLVTFWDYTTIKELEGHLQRSEHLAAIGQMTAGLAHEVKNPLGTIQMAADVIHEEVSEISINDKENLSRFSMILDVVQDIQDETKRLDNLVKKFLQMSKNKKSEEKLLRFSTINEKILQLLAHQFRYFDIELHVEQVSKEDEIFGDESQLIQAFMNLYLNAVEAMWENGGNLHVSILSDKDELIVEVADNGVGISPTKINRIFHPFFSNKQEGTGLGLSIAHDIIKEHGGRIDVESEEGLGTTFRVHLPKA